MRRFERRRFQRLVSEAIDRLPTEFREHLENVAVVVEDEPTDEQIRSAGLDPVEDTLLGLYDGLPLSERSHDFAMALPDRVILFYGPLVDACETETELREEIRLTLVHEIAHFFGMEDEEIEDLGY